MSADEVRRAWAYLSRVVEPPCPELTALVEREGPVEAAARVRSRRGLSDTLAGQTDARRGVDCAAADLELLARRGGRLLTADDDEWPHLAFTAFGLPGMRTRKAGAPLVLWAVGPQRLDDIAERAAAIVGTRAATGYGEHVAGNFATALVDRDVAVVSGGAFGIDGAAHRATLAADGITAAVLAGGIDVPYPAGHSALLHRIAGTGLLITEYPPGIRPARHRFLTRNRLVAAVTGATVVVEAGLRSGAASTAAWARSMGRPVCAVPGPVTSAASAGCHQLLRHHDAQLVTRPDEVVELVGRMGEVAAEPEHPGSPLDGLTDEQRTVYEALPGRGSACLDQITVAAGLPVRRVLGPLATLEIGGFVEQVDGRWRIARR